MLRIATRPASVFQTGSPRLGAAGGVARAATEASAEFGRNCAANSPKVFGHVGTPDAARDLDVARAAVGDRTLQYLGKSYGTMLGATYAELFPDKVGRMVLDGVTMDFSESPTHSGLSFFNPAAAPCAFGHRSDGSRIPICSSVRRFTTIFL